MSIFPGLIPDLQNQMSNISKGSTQEIRKIGRSFLFDFEKNEFVRKDGRLVELDEKSAIKQWIYLILQTYKDKFNVYKDSEFYCNIEDLKNAKPSGFVFSELKREITEALVKHRYIKGINDFETNYNKEQLQISFTVNLVDGTSLGVSLYNVSGQNSR